MNCHEVQNLLSAYYDGELLDDQAAAIAEHLAECSVCADELAEFEQLSLATQGLDEPQAPTEAIWRSLQKQLERRPDSTSAWWYSVWLRPRARLTVALAASLLVAAFAIGIWVWSTSHTERNHLAENFNAYLNALSEAPDQAQQVLLVNYEGKEVTLPQAAQTLGYTPVAGEHVPEGYSIEKIYLLEMPCCKCAQIVYRSDDGRPVAIFEHEMAQPIWFGDRPSIACQCNDKPTNLIQLSGAQLAASWKMGKRHVTLIGAKDLEEVDRLMDGFVHGRNTST